MIYSINAIQEQVLASAPGNLYAPPLPPQPEKIRLSEEQSIVSEIKPLYTANATLRIRAEKGNLLDIFA